MYVYVCVLLRLWRLNSVQQPFYTPAHSHTSVCAPLGGTSLKQEADVTARRVNIGRFVRACVHTH